LAYTYDSFDLFGPLTAFVHDKYKCKMSLKIQRLQRDIRFYSYTLIILIQFFKIDIQLKNLIFKVYLPNTYWIGCY